MLLQSSLSCVMNFFSLKRAYDLFRMRMCSVVAVSSELFPKENYLLKINLLGNTNFYHPKNAAQFHKEGNKVLIS
jgi:hypothetical protein